MTNLTWPDTQAGREAFEALAASGYVHWNDEDDGRRRIIHTCAGGGWAVSEEFDGEWDFIFAITAHTAACILCEAARQYISDRLEEDDSLVDILVRDGVDENRAGDGTDPSFLAESVVRMSTIGEKKP